ncbi:antibiotic biosynthesis monooxygenase [bacterium]|jgi:autoinducer 2-degrading protein|nr:antibiotic biosynthesis monooxygenase [Flavobacterium sp.]MDA7798664.1 antibiotic biosynthesis monooxygenase [Flavobacteriaceae bacterium]MDA9302949.1 antibiotic biosynthesis monooxygenase [bacterium]MBT6882181.1 antibiotic biosynthesis monooxygenase [Flavobacterium sp.]MBT7425306.1 antibiotic biosynthesis monooxygenase [Flavobacterium sp.]|tara:strand:- start:37 stop:333 length:297 start_codon:yes stop_codon:yes gene_type:complete
MLVRIVKMSFHPEHIETFLANFEKKKELIRKSKGCNLLELYREQHNSCVFFTYSYWDSEKDLNNYRDSQLFKEVWSNTKILFNLKPEAWSVDKISRLS